MDAECSHSAPQGSAFNFVSPPSPGSIVCAGNFSPPSSQSDITAEREKTGFEAGVTDGGLTSLAIPQPSFPPKCVGDQTINLLRNQQLSVLSRGCEENNERIRPNGIDLPLSPVSDLSANDIQALEDCEFGSCTLDEPKFDETYNASLRNEAENDGSTCDSRPADSRSEDQHCIRSTYCSSSSSEQSIPIASDIRTEGVFSTLSDTDEAERHDGTYVDGTEKGDAEGSSINIEAEGSCPTPSHGIETVPRDTSPQYDIPTELPSVDYAAEKVRSPTMPIETLGAHSEGPESNIATSYNEEECKSPPPPPAPPSMAVLCDTMAFPAGAYTLDSPCLIASPSASFDKATFTATTTQDIALDIRPPGQQQSEVKDTCGKSSPLDDASSTLEGTDHSSPGWISESPLAAGQKVADQLFCRPMESPDELSSDLMSSELSDSVHSPASSSCATVILEASSDIEPDDSPGPSSSSSSPAGGTSGSGCSEDAMHRLHNETQEQTGNIHGSELLFGSAVAQYDQIVDGIAIYKQHHIGQIIAGEDTLCQQAPRGTKRSRSPDLNDTKCHQSVTSITKEFGPPKPLTSSSIAANLQRSANHSTPFQVCGQFTDTSEVKGNIAVVEEGSPSTVLNQNSNTSEESTEHAGEGDESKKHHATTSAIYPESCSHQTPPLSLQETKRLADSTVCPLANCSDGGRESREQSCSSTSAMELELEGNWDVEEDVEVTHDFSQHIHTTRSSTEQTVIRQINCGNGADKENTFPCDQQDQHTNPLESEESHTEITETSLQGPTSRWYLVKQPTNHPRRRTGLSKRAKCQPLHKSVKT